MRNFKLSLFAYNTHVSFIKYAPDSATRASELFKKIEDTSFNEDKEEFEELQKIYFREMNMTEKQKLSDLLDKAVADNY